MKIFLVEAANDQGQYDVCRERRFEQILYSYAYRGDFGRWIENQLPLIEQLDIPVDLIVDSGAFTAFTTGKAVDIRDYLRWAMDLKDRLQHRTRSMVFMNLDVIGDQSASWTNQEYLERMGINPMPIVTYGASLDDLNRAITHYDYFALGGIVPISRQQKKLFQWLDHCFQLVMTRYRATGKFCKVHTLGISTAQVAYRYPVYSGDSSSWKMSFMRGSSALKGVKAIPPKKFDPIVAPRTQVASCRAALDDLIKIQIASTELWRRRGIDLS